MTFRKILLSVPFGLLALTGGAAPAWADFNAGVAAYDAGRYDVALKEWLPLAEKGDAAAMRNIGHLYRLGRGVPIDPAKAADWYRRAADAGLDRAMLNLAAMYLTGEGVPQSDEQAIRWLTKAADLGNPTAAYNLGEIYESGRADAPANLDAAKLYYGRAAAAGLPAAKEKLAALDGGAAPAGTDTPPPPTAAATPLETTTATPPPPAPVEAAAPAQPPAQPPALAPTLAPALAPAPAPAAAEPQPPAPTAPLPAPQAVAQAEATVSTPPAGAGNDSGFFGSLWRGFKANADNPTVNAPTPSADQKGAESSAKYEAGDALNALASLFSRSPQPAPGAPDADLAAGAKAATAGDPATALARWLPLAQAGNPTAQRLVGDLYARGAGVPVDRAIAAMWYMLAARGGDLAAADALKGGFIPPLTEPERLEATSKADHFKVTGKGNG